jgi:hypothetical protein
VGHFVRMEQEKWVIWSGCSKKSGPCVQDGGGKVLYLAWMEQEKYIIRSIYPFIRYSDVMWYLKLWQQVLPVKKRLHFSRKWSLIFPCSASESFAAATWYIIPNELFLQVLKHNHR